MSGQGLSLQTVDFTQALQTVLGAQKYRERFESSLPLLPSLATFDFSQIVREVLSNRPTSFSARESLRLLTAFARQPVSLLGLPPSGSRLFVCMQRGGKAPAAEAKGEHRDGFGFVHQAPGGSKGGEEDSADPASRASRVLSGFLGCDLSDQRMSRWLAQQDLSSLSGLEKVAKRVSTIYGFDGLSFADLEEMIKDGRSFRQSMIAKMHATGAEEYFNETRGGATSEAAIEQRGTFRESVIGALGISPDEIKQLKQAAFLLGLNLSEVTSKVVSESGCYEPANILESLICPEENVFQVGEGLTLFIDGKLDEFKKMFGKLESWRDAHENLLDETRSKMSELKKRLPPESEQNSEVQQEIEALHQLEVKLIQARDASPYGEVLFEIYVYVGEQLTSTEAQLDPKSGKLPCFLENPVFEYLTTDPRTQDTFKGSMENAFNRVISCLPPDDQDETRQAFKAISEESKKNIQRIKDATKEGVDSEKKAVLQSADCRNSEGGFDEEAGRKELEEIHQRYEKQKFAMLKLANLQVYQQKLRALKKFTEPKVDQYADE